MGAEFVVGAGPTEVHAYTDLDRASRRLAMHTGMFNLLWVVVLLLMVYRPGFTAGAGS